MDSTPPPALDAELRDISAQLDASLSAPDTGATRHQRIAGVLTMAMAGLVLLVAKGAVEVLQAFGFLSANDPFDRELASRFLFLSAAFALAAGVTGWAFWAGSRGARLPLGLVAVLFLPLFPVGTAVGAYVLWTLARTAREA
jgi:hypothetical protein